MDLPEDDPPTDAAAEIEEKRRHRRMRTLKEGLLVFRDGHCLMECAILDLSEGGAKLRLKDPLLCPDSFVLRTRFGLSRLCQVVWQQGRDIGVRYID